MTREELQSARAERMAALRPDEVNGENLTALVAGLGCATMHDLAAWSSAAPEILEGELAAARVVELTLWPGERRYCARELIEYVYVCVGDRHPRKDYQKQAEQGRLSWLAAEIYEMLLESQTGAHPAELRDLIGAERSSVLSVDRALQELAGTLKVVRTGRRQGAPVWRATVKALPEIVGVFDRVSLVMSAAALVSKRLDALVCETEDELALDLAPLHSRSRIHAALQGLEAGREISAENVEGKRAWRLRG